MCSARAGKLDHHEASGCGHRAEHVDQDERERDQHDVAYGRLHYGQAVSGALETRGQRRGIGCVDALAADRDDELRSRRALDLGIRDALSRQQIEHAAARRRLAVRREGVVSAIATGDHDRRDAHRVRERGVGLIRDEAEQGDEQEQREHVPATTGFLRPILSIQPNGC